MTHAKTRASLRRSLLYVPGSSPRMIAKSLGVDADAIIFDLEDAVSPPEKEAARQRVAEAIGAARQTGREIVVRVNLVASHLGLHDILAIVPQRPDTLIVPKADAAAMIAADTIVGAIEAQLGWEAGTIGLIPLMETAAAIADAAAIINAVPRIDGVQFGAEDLTKELGIARTAVGDELHHARSVLAFAGRARGIDVIDSPFVDVADTDALTAETRRVKALGMTGKTCIHPDQVAVVNRVFSPSPEEIAQARRIVEAFDGALREGKGACALDGKMIDNPIAERARQILGKAERIGARQTLGA